MKEAEGWQKERQRDANKLLVGVLGVGPASIAADTARLAACSCLGGRHGILF